ncbi:hypothetical protein, partial [Mycolicibacterium iranicum]|uniref:hypothetical protein n=1 Tax=Mycolicibacterium iranicum TaxID=912594 RepID=UPI000B2BAF34
MSGAKSDRDDIARGHYAAAVKAADLADKTVGAQASLAWSALGELHMRMAEFARDWSAAARGP